MSSETPSLRQKAGFVLCRFVVPVWVLSGALFKLFEHTPRLLPELTVLKFGKWADLDLYLFLAALIAIEFVAVAVMLLVGRLARPVAIAILGVFCAVLIGEMVQGNVESCGCLGAASPPPYVMLIIDGLLLAGVVVLGAGAPSTSKARWPVPAAAVAAVVGIAVSFIVVMSASRAVPPPLPVNGDNGDNGDNLVSDDPTVNTGHMLPTQGWWVTPADISDWVGMPWRKVPLVQFMRTWPKDMDTAVRYMVFYSRTCDHCQEMFDRDLTDPALGSMTVAVEVPESKTLLTSPDAWFMPSTEVEHLSLPLGYDWIMTTPVTLRIENGIVTGAQEGGHEDVMFDE